MKKQILGITIFCCVIISSQPSYAELKNSEETERLAKHEAQIKKMDAAGTELNGSSWTITIKPAQNMKSSLQSADTVYFQDGKFRSENMTKKEFLPTHYSLNIRDDEALPIIWETMQTSRKGDVMFWRGEWFRTQNVMTGTIVKQDTKNGNENYNFSSTGYTRITPETQTEAASSISVENEINSKSLPVAKEEKKKKKKSGWF